MNQLIKMYDIYLTELFKKTELSMAKEFFRIEYILSGEEPQHLITDAQIRVKFAMYPGNKVNMNFENGGRDFYRNNKENISNIEFEQLFSNEQTDGWEVTHIYGMLTFIRLYGKIDMDFIIEYKSRPVLVKLIKQNLNADEDVVLWAKLQ